MIIDFIKKDKQLQLFLFVCFIIQVFFSWTQVGFFHPDQHFQIIEFSSYQLNEPSFATKIWEFNDKIRPTFQVYLFSGFRLVLNAIGITNPFTIISVVQTLTGVLMFLLFNAIAIFYCKNCSRKTLFWVIAILNLSWSFCFVRSMFSSETLGALLFFGAVYFYDKKENKTAVTGIITGFLLGFSFFARFQMAFAIIGFGLYILWFKKEYKQLFYIIISFLIAVGINIFLDKEFYHQLVFTPYNYYYTNIVKGVANGFGTSSFLVYIGILAGVCFAPFLSIILFGLSIKSLIKNFQHPLVITTFFFVLGHCFIGHKEERFLYPIFCCLPIIVGLQLDNLFRYLNNSNLLVKYFLKFCIVVGLALNFFLLIILSQTPYSQTVYFDKLLQKKFNNQKVDIYYVDRTCFQTESHLQFEFYKQGMSNINLIQINNVDTLDILKPKYFVSTFNQLDNKFNILQKTGYEPILTSSKILWNINEYLYSKKANTINDIWMLYERK